MNILVLNLKVLLILMITTSAVLLNEKQFITCVDEQKIPVLSDQNLNVENDNKGKKLLDDIIKDLSSRRSRFENNEDEYDTINNDTLPPDNCECDNTYNSSFVNVPPPAPPLTPPFTGGGDGRGSPPSDPPEEPPETESDYSNVSISISGKIIDNNTGLGLKDVLIYISSRVAALTDNEGYYRVMLPYNWSGSLTPVDVNYHFTPSNYTLSNIVSNITDADFIADHLVPIVPIIGVTRASDSGSFFYQGSQPENRYLTSDFEYHVVFNDSNIYAELTWLGDSQWELSIKPKVSLSRIWFPYQDTQSGLNGDSSDDVVYIPRNLGVAMLNDALGTSLWGPLYPGNMFAPLVVRADDKTARMISAVNWPPIPCRPAYARNQTGILYQNEYNAVPAINETRTYKMIDTMASGDSSIGLYPWYRVLDKYKQWLITQVVNSELNPVYPEWMINGEGTMNVHLEGASNEYLASDLIINDWDEWKHLFPYIIMWGQMSDHLGSCCARPPPYIHPRYIPRLLEIVDHITQDGHLAFYSRVFEGQLIDGLTNESLDNLRFLLNWIENNTYYGANFAYIDVLGLRYFGDPYTIAHILKDTLQPGTMIEGLVDIYPASALMLDSVTSNYFSSGPGLTDCIERLNETITSILYPRFGRYIFDDRILFIGTSNTGRLYWGANNNHWTERQVFLLGSKFYIHQSMIEEPAGSGVLNFAVGLITSLREQVHWWEREPIYRDRYGIYNIPPYVDVRRFDDNTGKVLFVIDNWSEYEGLYFTYNGEDIPIPSSKLSIIEYQ